MRSGTEIDQAEAKRRVASMFQPIEGQGFVMIVPKQAAEWSDIDGDVKALERLLR